MPHTATTASIQDDDDDDGGNWQWLGIGGGVGICVGIVIGMFLMFAWQRKLGILSYCSDDHSTSQCTDGIPCKGACGSDEEYYKKTTANVENGTMPNSDSLCSPIKAKNDYVHAIPNGNCHYPSKGNNYTSQLPKCDQSNASCGVNCTSLHERRTSQPAKIIKIQESPQRYRSQSTVQAPTMVPVTFTQGAVSNRDMARYGSNYSLDPETSKPTLTPTNKNRVYFDRNRDSIDLDPSLYKSTDC